MITAQATDVAGNSGPLGAPVRVIVNNKPLVRLDHRAARGRALKTTVTVAASRASR